MRKPADSSTGTVARMRWPRPTLSMHCAQCGIRDVIDLLGKVPEKLFVERLECWVWDQVYTPNAMSVLSLALCMVIDVIFPIDGRRCHQNCWAGTVVSNLLAALGVARLRVIIRRDGRAGSSECCLPNGCKKVSGFLCPFVSRIREVCSVKFPTGGFGSSIVYLLAGHCGVYVGKAGLDRRRMCGMGPRALEHLRTLLYTCS